MYDTKRLISVLFFKKPFMILSSNIIVAGNKKQGALIAKKNTYCPVQITPPPSTDIHTQKISSQTITCTTK